MNVSSLLQDVSPFLREMKERSNERGEMSSQKKNPEKVQLPSFQAPKTPVTWMAEKLHSQSVTGLKQQTLCFKEQR